MWALLLFYPVEAAVLAFLGLALLGIKPGLKKILTIGVLQGIAVFLIRNIYRYYDIQLGTHIFFTLAAMIIIVRYVSRIGWGEASAAAILAFIVLAVDETIGLPVTLNMVGINFKTSVNNSFWHIVIAYLGEIPIYIMAFIVGFTNFSLFKLKL